MKTITINTILANLDQFDYIELVQLKYNPNIDRKEFNFRLFEKLEYLYKTEKFFINPGLFGSDIDFDNIYNNL